MKASGCYILTGCASGIGLHLTKALLTRGIFVVATDVNQEGLESALRPYNADKKLKLMKLDVTQEEDWERVLGEAKNSFGTIDVVMNIAGFLRPGWVEEVSSKDIDLHFSINVKGVILGTKTAAAAMVEQGFGHIINIASMAALAPIPGLSLYSASKYAVRSFSLSAAVELKDKGVSVTVVCPDAVQTPMLDLQKGDERAALTFSGPKKFLEVQDIEFLILDKVLRKKPLEAVLPWHRGWLARFGDLFPSLLFWLRPSLAKKGLARQQELKKE